MELKDKNVLILQAPLGELVLLLPINLLVLELILF